jgi:methylmalonyl-CoA mutase C-terminal domain/subunit
MQRRIRVLVGKPGLDGHDRGAKVVAAALRDAGMEVIYTGLHQTPEQIVEAAVQEDVDVLALSVLSGAHMTLFPEVLRLMRDRGIADRLLTGGGIIPNEDMATLARDGVGRLFGPGTNTQDIVSYIRDWYAGMYGADALPPLPPAPAPAHPVVEEGERPRPSPARERAPAPAAKAKAKAKAPKRRPPAKPARRKAAAKPARRKVAAKPARVKAAAKKKSAAKRTSRSTTRTSRSARSPARKK